jgi:hypothetical protein
MIVNYDKELDRVYISKNIGDGRDDKWVQVGLEREEVRQIIDEMVAHGIIIFPTKYTADVSDIVIRDSGERGCSTGIAAAYSRDLDKKYQKRHVDKTTVKRTKPMDKDGA